MSVRALFALCVMTTLLNPISADAEDIQFVEEFVLSADRDKAIEQLIPGTDEYYFYQCIHLQNNQRYDEVDKLLNQWQQRHRSTANLQEILRRQMLLVYANHPKRTLDYLIRELSPNLNHQQDRLEKKPRLPTQLNPNKISYETVRRTLHNENNNKTSMETKN